MVCTLYLIPFQMNCLVILDKVVNKTFISHFLNHFFPDSLHLSTPVLSAKESPSKERRHAQSDPVTSPSNGTSLDPALQALSATYQALNLTARAFGDSQENGKLSLENPATSVSDIHDNPELEAEIAETLSQLPKEALTNGVELDDELEHNISSSTLKEINMHNNNNTKIDPLDDAIESNTDNNHELAIISSNNGIEKPTVDDFFKSLMESVPKNVMEKFRNVCLIFLNLIVIFIYFFFRNPSQI